MKAKLRRFWTGLMAHPIRRRVVHVVGAILGLGLCGFVLLQEGGSLAGGDFERAKRSAFGLLEDWKSEGRPMTYTLVPRLEQLGPGAIPALQELIGSVNSILKGQSTAPPVGFQFLGSGEDAYEARLASIEDYQHLRKEANSAIGRIKVAAYRQEAARMGGHQMELEFMNDSEYSSMVFKFKDGWGRTVMESEPLRANLGFWRPIGLAPGREYSAVATYDANGARQTEDLGKYRCEESDRKVSFYFRQGAWGRPKNPVVEKAPNNATDDPPSTYDYVND